MLFITMTITRTVNILDYKETITDANNLYEAVMLATKGSKWKESSQKSLNDTLTMIFNMSNKLISKTYKCSKQSTFVVHERGRIRSIDSYNVQDRSIRHVLCDKIFMPKIRNKIIYDNSASIKGRGISHARNRFVAHLRKYYMHYGTNNGYIMFGDYSKYYDNILHEIAKNQLLELVDYDEYISWLLDIIFRSFEIDCSDKTDYEINELYDGVFNKLEYVEPNDKKYIKTLKKSISIGDQLSQVIGVWYPHEIDNYIKIVKSQKYYGRYMDDWYLISNSKNKLLDIFDDIQKESIKLGLHINLSKTYITKLNSRYKFLQVKHTLTNNGKVIRRINPKRVTTMRRRLKKLKNKMKNNEIEYCNIENMFKAWTGSFYKLISKQQKDNLINLYETLFDKHITIKQNKMYIFDKEV